MPPAVHAVLVTRTTPAAVEALKRAIDALRAQTRPVDLLTLVVCGDPERVRPIAEGSGAEGVIEAAAGTTFAAAVEFALRRVPESSAVWLLDNDSVPDPPALQALSAALERGPSIAIAAPKLVDREETSRIVSLGQTMTRWGRSVELADGEYDQGQFDARDDVLGADVRGMLVRSDLAAGLVPDRALLGIDEGLDLGVRAHLAARRVALVPQARVVVPAPPRGGRARAAYLRRTAQLHRRLAYAPAWAVALHWLSLLPLALWRTAVLLIAKTPALVPGEWASAVVAMVRIGSVARSRRRIRALRTASWAHVDPLRADPDVLRERRSQPGGSYARPELHFFSGGGAWTVLGALVVSIGAFFALLSWPGVGGGGLLPLAHTVGALWSDAAYGQRAVGVDVFSAADPFSAVIAVIGSLWPGSPSYALLVLWLLALPLAVLGAWFAATRVTSRSGLRALVAVAWGLSPTLLAALIDPRPAAVIAHLLLPWLFYAGAAAHRSWGPSASASILLAAVVACAPSLAPVLVVVWAIALLLTIAFRPRGVARVVWTVVPAAVVFAPLVVAQLKRGTPWALLADPGSAWEGTAPSAAPDGEAFLAWLGWDLPLAWAPVLLAPVALAALLAPLTRRWRLGVGLVVVAVLGIGTAYAVGGIQVATAGAAPVAVWQGSAWGLAWLALVLAAAVALDVGFAPRALKAAFAFVMVLGVAVSAVPALTSVHRGSAALHSASDSTLPAIVRAEARDAGDVGTLLLTPLADGSIVVRVVWGPTETLGGQSTLQSTAGEISTAQSELAQLAGDLVSGASTDVPTELAGRGIGFVVLETDDDADRERVLSAVTEMDQRGGMTRVGTTDSGDLWRVDVDVSARTEPTPAQTGTASTIGVVQLLAILVALLLALPTPASLREARRTARVIGGRFEEER